MDVRAAVAFEAGKPLSIETVQLEGPREGEVLVEVKATGICHTDEDFSPPFLATKAPVSWLIRDPA
jgi:Zn-dependent alcohol dehydrogenase